MNKSLFVAIRNWKTTAMAIILAIMATSSLLGNFGTFLNALIDGDASTVPNWDSVALAFGELIAAIGLLLAKDGDKTSRQLKLE